MSTTTPFLRLTPGLLRTPALDPVTGGWSQPWAQHWMRQADTIATMMQAAILGDLSVFEAVADVGTLAQTLDEAERATLLAGTLEQSALMRALDEQRRFQMTVDALTAHVTTLSRAVEDLRRLVASLDALTPRVGRLTQQVEALQRQAVLDA